MTQAIVLLSGGIDSAVALALALRSERVTALSVDYGQRHRIELDAAARLAERFEVRHVTSAIDLRAIGGSALTADVPLERGRSMEDMVGTPASYVPGRNTVLLSIALAWADALGAHAIHIGANALDVRGYPDCRPEYLAAFGRVTMLATSHGPRSGVQVCAPLIRYSKARVVRLGLDLGVDMSLTSSCYDPTPGGACGVCDACVIRLAAFAELAEHDPIGYRGRP